MGININPIPPKSPGPQKMLHYPSWLRFDCKWYNGASIYADGVTDSDITLMPSTVLYGGVSQGTEGVDDNMNNLQSYVGQMYNENSARSVAAAGYLRMTGIEWMNSYNRLRSIRYSTYKAINTIDWPGDSNDDPARTLKIIELDSSRFLVYYIDDGDNKPYAVAGEIASDGTVTVGARQQIVSSAIFSNAPQYIDAVKIATDKVAFVARHTTNYPFAIVCTIDANEAITVGTPVQINAVACSVVAICALDTDKFAVSYENNSNNTIANACTVSGTVPTIGANKTITSSTEGRYPVMTQTGTDKMVIACGSANNTELTACTVSGTTITDGTPISAPAENVVSLITSQAEDKFTVITNVSGRSNEPNVGTYTVSGTTITEADTGYAPASGAIGYRTTSVHADIFVYDTTKILAIDYKSVSTNAAFDYNVSMWDTSGDTITNLGGDFSGYMPGVVCAEEIDDAKATFGLGVGSVYLNQYSAGNTLAVGVVGSYGILIGSTAYNTGGTGAIIVCKNGTTEFFNGGSGSDVSLGSQTPVEPPFMVHTFKTDTDITGSRSFIKIQNDSAETMNYEFFDVSMIVE